MVRLKFIVTKKVTNIIYLARSKTTKLIASEMRTLILMVLPYHIVIQANII